MTTSYTSLLGLALPVTGELPGAWGDTVNDYITKYVDAAVAGAQTISGSQTTVTLSTTTGGSLTSAGSGSTGSAQYAIINCTGNPASLLTITAPAASKVYLVLNNTSTSQSVKVVGAGPTTGVTVAANQAALIAWNGTDFELVATNDISAISGLLPVSKGGTGLTTIPARSAFVANTLDTLTTITPGAGQSIRINAGNTAWEVYTPTTGTGDVTASASNAFTGANTFFNSTGQTFGTATSTNDGIVLAGRAGGSSNYRVTLQPTTLTASRTLTLPNNSGTVLTTGAAVTETQGGTGNTSYSTGQILYASATNTLSRLNIGTTGQVLTVGAGNVPVWQSAAAAGVSSFSAGTTGFTPNTGTTGAITLAGTLATSNGGTGLTTFTAANRALYSTSSSALTAGTLPVAAGGTGAATFSAGFVKSPGATGALTTSSTVNLASEVTGTLPVANGGTGESAVSGVQSTFKIPYGPIFSAYANSGDQAVTSGVTTKITISSEDYDSAACYNTTNSRFLPTTAGYYQIEGVMRGAAGTGATGAISYSVEIRKNGLTTAGNIFRGNENTIYLATGTDQFFQSTVSAIIYFNGSSDYVELFGGIISNGATPRFIDNYSTFSLTSRFQGSLIRYA